MHKRIRIVEVGPRDGLQNEAVPISTEAKIRFVRNLAVAGLEEIEATSFVSPKWVPQLSDAEALWRNLPVGPTYSALVPNERGLQRAMESGVQRIAVFTAASETFTQRNIAMSVDRSLGVFAATIQAFRRQQPKGWVRGYVSTAFECPYEGRVDPSKTAEVALRLIDLGVDEVSLGDTIGTAAPLEVKSLTEFLERFAPLERFAYHFHDTHGTAIANVAQAIESGVTVFDASAGGLGGCPFAPGAGGNLATEDLVYFLRRSGFETPIDLTKLAEASLEILELLGRSPSAKCQLAQLPAAGKTPK